MNDYGWRQGEPDSRQYNYRKTTNFVILKKQLSYISSNKKVIQQARAAAFCGEWCGRDLNWSIETESRLSQGIFTPCP